MSFGEVGECKPRRGEEPPNDLAAVLRRMASCRFIDGVAVAAGDFFAGDAMLDTGGITRDLDLGRDGEVTVAGGEVDVGEVMMRDFLMGF